jgi:hypothetical protein
VTARYYGETDELLGRYGWYIAVSNDRETLSVGMLRPNDFGLFDVLGNVFSGRRIGRSIANRPIEDRSNSVAVQVLKTVRSWPSRPTPRLEDCATFVDISCSMGSPSARRSRH